MRRMVWAFARRTYHIIGNLYHGSFSEILTLPVDKISFWHIVVKPNAKQLVSGVILTLYKPETPKHVLLQTMQTQMNCHLMWHCIRVCIVISDKIYLERQKYIFLEIITSHPSENIIKTPDLTISNFMETTIGIEWLS